VRLLAHPPQRTRRQAIRTGPGRLARRSRLGRPPLPRPDPDRRQHRPALDTSARLRLDHPPNHARPSDLRTGRCRSLTTALAVAPRLRPRQRACRPGRRHARRLPTPEPMHRRRARTTTARGYGWQHQKQRARLLPLAYGTSCPICLEIMYPWQQLDLHHSTPLSIDPHAVGDQIVHASCNRFGKPPSQLRRWTRE